MGAVQYMKDGRSVWKGGVVLGSSIAHRMGTEDERFVDQRKLRNAHSLLRNGMRGKERKMERSSAPGEVITALVTIEELHAIPERVHLRGDDA